jgi:hypothetical protein
MILNGDNKMEFLISLGTFITMMLSFYFFFITLTKNHISEQKTFSFGVQAIFLVIAATLMFASYVFGVVLLPMFN